MKTTKAKRKVAKRKAVKKQKLPWHQGYLAAVTLIAVGASMLFTTGNFGNGGLLKADINCSSPSTNISAPEAKNCTDQYTVADPIGGDDANYNNCLSCCGADNSKCKIGCISKRSYLKSCTEAGLKDAEKNAISNASALNSIDDYLKDATGNSADTAYKNMANQETQNATQAQTALAQLKNSSTAGKVFASEAACKQSGCQNCVRKTAASGAAATPAAVSASTNQDSFFSSSKVCGGYTSENECMQNKDKCHWDGDNCFDGADTTPAPVAQKVPEKGKGENNAYCTENEQCIGGECFRNQCQDPNAG
jgi:hypothetical protein